IGDFCDQLCGDGVVSAGEECDDGNSVSGDGCDQTCGEEPGYDCDDDPSQCESTCGDGERASDEACDDGNTRNGDGCSSTCELEGDTCADTSDIAMGVPESVDYEFPGEWVALDDHTV